METTREPRASKKTQQKNKRHPLERTTLDELALLDSAALYELYRSSVAPASVKVLDGFPRGRMLAVRGLDVGVAAGTVRAIASSGMFPWGGKSFASVDSQNGTGINRVHLGGRHNLFAFVTTLDASAIDGEPAVILNYAIDDNPALVRRIHDEVREVAPGVFFGPAMWKSGDEKTLVLWFALDTNTQAVPVTTLGQLPVAAVD
jgi:hypothetical protein